MIKVAEIERIRYAHFREGLSLRELSRTFHHSRKTIRKALEDPGPWSYRRLATRPAPVMDAVAEVIQLWLAEDLDRPRKQRHTAHRVYERLVDEHGFSGGESTVRQWVCKHRPKPANRVTIPLAHDAGAEAQIDFGKGVVRIAGVDTVVQLFCARLAYSTRDVVRAYRRQDRAAWLDGHVHAFSTWGGVPAVIWYDNPSGLGSFRQGKFTPCDEFLALQSAYGFRAHHCTPGEAHEKGLVEGLVGYSRRNYLVPLPAVDHLNDLNDYLARKTADEERRIRQGKHETVGARFAEERSLLGPLAQRPFLACTRHPVRASQQALCTFEGSRYSVPVRFAGAKLWLRAFADQVEIWCATACLASWPRALTKGTLSADFWHFVPALVRKPGAFRQAIPVRQATFPPEAQEILLALERRHASDLRRAHREFLTICTLQLETDPVRWRAACATALARGDVSSQGVRDALNGVATKAGLTRLPERLAGVEVPAGDVAQYSRLLGSGT